MRKRQLLLRPAEAHNQFFLNAVLQLDHVLSQPD